MTQPTDPAPPTPAPAPTPTPAPAPGPAPGPTPAPGPAPGPTPTPTNSPAEDLSTLPDFAQKLIRDLRAEAAAGRTTAKQNAATEAKKELAAQVAKALGIDSGDDPPDPAQLTEQIEAAQASAWRSGVELNVYRAASKLGANAEALLDSLSFIDSLDDLVGVDARSPDFATQLEAKITAAVERNPAFRAGQAPTPQPPAPGAPRPDPSQGPRGTPAAARTRSLAEAVAQQLQAAQGRG